MITKKHVKHIVCFLFWLPAFVARAALASLLTAIVVTFGAILFPMCYLEAVHRWACKDHPWEFSAWKNLKKMMYEVWFQWVIKGETIE